MGTMGWEAQGGAQRWAGISLQGVAPGAWSVAPRAKLAFRVAVNVVHVFEM